MPDDDVLIDALYSAYNRHDADAVAALYEHDGEHEDVATGRPARGPEVIAAGLRRFLAAFPDAHWSVEDRIQSGARAFGKYVLTGTLQRDMGPFPASGQRLRLPGVHVLEISNGRITRSQDFWDSATFQRQMTIHTTGEADTAT